MKTGTADGATHHDPLQSPNDL